MSGSWQGAGFGATGNATIVGQEEVGHVRRPEVPRSRRSPAHFRFDKASTEGSFKLHIYDEDKFVPVLLRDDKKYVSIRMAEISVLGEFLNLLPPELYDHIKISSYFSTKAEARLLNHINNWHCDGFYGSEKFTMSDKLICLEDLTVFFEFLQFSFRVLHSGGKNVDSDCRKCGFIKQDQNDDLLPYTVLESGEKVMPTTYFFKSVRDAIGKSQLLRGWPLAYLKVCFYLEDSKKDNSVLEVFNLADIQAYFSKCSFTECWPEPKSKSLFSEKVLRSLKKTTMPQIKSEKWTIMAEWKIVID